MEKKWRERFQYYLFAEWLCWVQIIGSLWLIKEYWFFFSSLLRTFRGCRRRRWDIWYWMAWQHHRGPRRSTKKKTKTDPWVQCGSIKKTKAMQLEANSPIPVIVTACLVYNIKELWIMYLKSGKDSLLQASVDSPSSWQRSDHQVSSLEPCLINNW